MLLLPRPGAALKERDICAERRSSCSSPGLGLNFLQRFGLEVSAEGGEQQDGNAQPGAFSISSLMASGVNKSRQPGTCSGSKAPRGSSAEGYNKEIHMQMCKKIAQLTKVSCFLGR